MVAPKGTYHWWIVPRTWPSGWFGEDYGVTQEMLNCPSGCRRLPEWGDYVWTGGGYAEGMSGSPPTDWPQFYRGFNRNRLPNPQRWPLACDFTSNEALNDWLIFGQEWSSCTFGRNHPGGMNFLLADLHVQWYLDVECDNNHVYGWRLQFPAELPVHHGNAAYHVHWPWHTGKDLVSSFDNVLLYPDFIVE